MHILLIGVLFHLTSAHGQRADGCHGEECFAHEVSAHMLLQSNRLSKKAKLDGRDDSILDSKFSTVVDLLGSNGEPPSPFLPLCDPSIVTRACAVLNGNEFGDASEVTKSMLATFLATNESNVCFDDLHADGMTCMDLCKYVVDYLADHGSYVVPNASDLACVTASDGRTTCEVDVRPSTIAKESNLYAPKVDSDGGHKELHAAFLYKSNASGSLRRSKREDPPARMQQKSMNSLSNGDLLYSDCAEFAVQIANLFRVHPSLGEYVPIGGPEGNLSLASTGVASIEKLHEYHAIADAWASTVLNELNGGTASSFRQEWFGGGGSKSESQVKDRLVKTFNFIKRELQQGFHYVFPADSAAGTGCGDSTMAYVWSWVREGNDYHETQGPECSADASGFKDKCGVDTNGKYFVYICNWWSNFDKQEQIATIVHEAAHHAGPSDQSYDPTTMKNFDQSTQLDNAANYQNFGRDVVETAWGCNEPETVAISGYSCGGEDCPCSAYSSLCGSNAEVTEKCPSTCGTCADPTGSASSYTTAPAPAPHACTDSETYKDPQYGDLCTGWVGYQCTGYEYTEELQANCPAACNMCSAAAPAPPPATTTTTTTVAPAPAPSDCTDSSTYKDPQFGDLCTGWVGYQCTGYEYTEDLQANCPAACNMCSAAAPTPATTTTTPCVDSSTYKDPQYGDLCTGWVGYKCTGYEYTEELQANCPVACKQC